MLYICMYCMYVDIAAAQAGDSYIYVCYVPNVLVQYMRVAEVAFFSMYCTIQISKYTDFIIIAIKKTAKNISI